MKPELFQAGKDYVEAGLTIIPVNARKKPAIAEWKSFENGRRTSLEDIEKWSKLSHACGWAVICGPPSENVTILDFDVPGFLEKWMALVGDLAGRLPIQQTGSGDGRQVAFKSSLNLRNDKLAYSPADNKEGREIAIETRGEGGYAVVPPSFCPQALKRGIPHKQAYKTIQGFFTQIPTIPPEEAQRLIEAARSLCQAPLSKRQMHAAPLPPRNNGGSSGGGVIGAFNEFHEVGAILERNSYQPRGNRYLAPDSTTGEPGVYIFEDTGRCFSHHGNDPLNDGHSHDPFSVFCILEHGGDVKAAVKAAAELGIERPPSRITLRQEPPEQSPEPEQDYDRRELPPDRRGPQAEKQSPEPVEPQGTKQPTIADLVCDVSTFISIEFPEKHNIINPWLSESTINMIYGPRGVGKTMFALGVLCAATTGEPFGSWQVNTPVPSLYLDGEMAPQDTQNRLNRFPSLKNQDRQPLIIYCDAQMNQYGLPRANLLDDEWRKVMKQLLLANDIKLWIADNIASLAPGIDENSKQEWDPINQWFLELRFAGITTIFLHHANKDGGQRGTSGREDNIDISMLLDKPRNYAPEDGARFVVKFQKARIEHKYLPLITDTEFALETDEEENYFWTYGTVKKQHKNQVLTMLGEGMKATDIASELGINKSRVSQIKAEAVKEGLLTKEGKLTQSGVSYVSKN